MKIIRNNIIALSILLFAGNIFGQEVEFKKSNFKDKKDEFDKIELQLEKGDEFLEKANEAIALVEDPGDNFKRALVYYLEAQEFNPNSAMLNMKIGNCYLYSNEKQKAIPYIEKAYELNKEIDPMLHFYRGRTLQLEQKFDEAIDSYKIFEETGKNKRVEEYKKITRNYKKECKYGKELVPNKARAWVDHVKGVNSDADDFSPCLSADGELLTITSRRKNDHQPNDLGEYDADIYSAKLNGDKWEKPVPMKELNTEGDETATALAYDGQRLLVHKMNEENRSYIFESELEGAKWGPLKKKMDYITPQKDNHFSASYEPLDIKLYYITDKKGDYNIDLSGVMVEVDNKWGKGQSVGHKVNTPFHEGSVYVHADGKTMYFSSQGHNSMGGYDIFVSRWEGGEWLPPVSLGYPINTTYDDKFFAATANGKYAYIASNRPGGEGGYDIYKVTFWGPEKPMAIDSEDYLLASIASPIKDNVVAKPVEVEKNSLTVFKGNVIDAITKKPIEAEIEIIDNALGNKISDFTSNSATGKFLLSLPAGKNYGISVKKDGYLFHSENFNLPDGSDFNLVEKTIELKNIKIGSKIALRNVFFETGKSDVTSESYPELDRLVKLMNDVPGLKIEVSGHTDNQGSEDLNNTLSQDRADAVKKYLVGKGVANGRLQSKGYGPSRPVASNDNSEGRALNRRTELEIIAN